MSGQKKVFGRIQRALQDDMEKARLRLALLKENSRFRAFIDGNRDRILRDYRRMRDGGLPGVVRVDPDGNEVDALAPVSFDLVGWFHERLLVDFGVQRLPCRSDDDLTPEEAFAFIDPRGDIAAIPDKKRDRALSRIFFTHGIWQVEADGPGHGPGEWAVRRLCTLNERPGSTPREWWDARFGGKPPLSGLRAWERVYLVDFRKSKARLMAEFEAILDSMLDHRRHAGKDERERDYSSWAPDNKRLREEAWRHLKVWQLRRQRKGFREIARALALPIDVAKKSFYKAYELIEGVPYDRERFKLTDPTLRQCSTCPDHPDRGGTCCELCPDMLELTEGPSAGRTYENFEAISGAVLVKEWLTREARDLQAEEDDQN